MPDGRTITIKIDSVAGNNSGAKKVVSDVEKEVIQSQKRVEAATKATNKAVEANEKATANARIKENKRVANDFLSTLKSMEGESKKSSSTIIASFTGAFAGSFAGTAIFSTIKSGLTDILGLAEEAGTKLFDMAKEASDLGRTFGSFQTKTGLAADSISTLNVAAHLSNKELTDLQRPLVMFTKNLGEAAAGSEKTANFLHKLGVTNLKDLEKSFSQALDGLQKMPPGVLKMNAAAELFGRRGGLDMLSVLAKMPGGFDEAKKHAAALGETLSQDDIDAAKAFGVAYDQVAMQVKIATAKFATQYAPQITDAIKEISHWLADNKGQVVKWGETVSNTAYGVQGYFQDLENWFKTHTLKPRLDNSWLVALDQYMFGKAGEVSKPMAGGFGGGYDSRFDILHWLTEKGKSVR